MPRPSAPPIALASPPLLLTPPVVVVSPDGQYDLGRGALSIGRSGEADIPLTDPLVSRLHARVVVVEGCVAIEDLHSTNGVYVNGARLSGRSVPLREGDRILLGTCELSVFGARARAGEVHPTPTAVWTEPADGTDGPPETDRADALQMIGRLAQRLHRSGNEVEATRVLSAHLNKVLLGASAGLALSDTLLHQTALYALELLEWTGNGSWLDYVIELHLSVQQLPSEATLACLEMAMNQTRAPFDSELFRYFLTGIERARPGRSLQDEAKLARLRRLLD